LLLTGVENWKKRLTVVRVTINSETKPMERSRRGLTGMADWRLSIPSIMSAMWLVRSKGVHGEIFL
jgi:hypothetical protein